jgi:hypothetical protein
VTTLINMVVSFHRPLPASLLALQLAIGMLGPATGKTMEQQPGPAAGAIPEYVAAARGATSGEPAVRALNMEGTTDGTGIDSEYGGHRAVNIAIIQGNVDVRLTDCPASQSALQRLTPPPRAALSL